MFVGTMRNIAIFLPELLEEIIDNKYAILAYLEVTSQKVRVS